MNNCINIIKLTILKNKKGFIIANNNKNLNIIKAFIKLNIIKFIKIKDKSIIGYINYINNKPIFKNIVNMFRSSGKKYINIKEIKKLSINHNWILIISTNKGIINSLEALNFNIGGLLLAVIWN